MLTKGKFLEFIELLKDDPNFLCSIVNKCFSYMPKNLADSFARQLYYENSYVGIKYLVTNLLNGHQEYFMTPEEVNNYLSSLGYKPTRSTVQNCCMSKSHEAYNHRIEKIKD